MNDFDPNVPDDLLRASFKLAVGAIFAVVFGAAALPAQAVELHGVLHGISHHFQERNDGKAKEYRERNPGAGVRFEFSADWSAQIGAYKNSIDRDSAYAIADWTPVGVGPVRAGIFGGVASGYAWKTVAGLTGVVGGIVRAQVSDWSIALRATPKHPKASAVVALEIGYRF